MSTIAKLTHFDEIEDQINEYWEKGLGDGFSTGFPELDKYMKLQKGGLYVLGGIPNSGKTEIMDQIILQTVALHGWHWTVWSPENWPLGFHFQKLAEKWIGKPWKPMWERESITDQERKDTIKDLSGCISLVEPSEDDCTIDAILDLAKQAKDKYNTDAIILDPYNEIEHNRPDNMSETEYIGKFLTKIRNFGRVHNVAFFVVAHPTKLRKREDGNYEIPTPYDLAGSANWRNKADICFSIWRDYNKKDWSAEIHIQKVRNKNHGETGVVDFFWDKPTGIYSEKADYLIRGIRNMQNERP